MSNFLRDYPMIIVPAGGQIVQPGLGSLFIVRESSAGFDWEADNSGKNFAEGGWEFDFGAAEFRRLTVYNRSATAQLTIDARIGFGSGKRGAKFDYLRVRGTKPVGTPIKLPGTVTVVDGVITAGAANLVSIPGVASNGAGYVAAGIAVGARRRQAIFSSTSQNTMYICDANNVILAVMGQAAVAGSPAFGFTFENDTDLKLGGTINEVCQVMELFNI